MTGKLAHIYAYPVKGLSAQKMETATLSPGQGLPHDRRFAIAHGTTSFDPANLEWMPKTNFLMLMRNERLAQLETAFDPDSGLLTISRDGKQVARGNITEKMGRTLINQFLGAFLKKESRGAPKIIEAPADTSQGTGRRMFSDTPARVLSAIGLASLKDLERVTGKSVDPSRFRANLYIEGLPPWEEFTWVGKQITIGGVRFKITKRIDRCAAVNVNPRTAERDMNLPLSLQKGFGHVNTGVYAEVISGGTIALNDEISSP